MGFYLYIIIFISFLYPNPSDCLIENIQEHNYRSIYSIGDTLTLDDQNRLFPVCSGNEVYETGDSFSFSDLNGDLNGGNYKITLISKNATW